MWCGLSSKVDIDKERTSIQTRKKLAEMEQHTDNLPYDCWRCAYRDKDVNMCWYTITTNKYNNRTKESCNHFVNEDDWE